MIIVYSNELQHHGIMGQKWGVRRFQNADGSYTAAGKKRYSVGEQKKINKIIKSSSAEKRNKNLLKNENVKAAIQEYKDRVSKIKTPDPEVFHDEYYNQPNNVRKKYMKKYVDEMVKEFVNDGFIDPEKDKEYIKNMYDLKNDIVLENEYAREHSMYDYLKDTGKWDAYEEACDKSVEKFRIARELSTELLGAYGDQPIKPNKNSNQSYDTKTILSWSIAQIGERQMKQING